ncbi:YeeE/YedE family protein [Rhodovulum sp. YNF3179]|uniref:YeeE/YedE family protein n=1 Tax=Rhodovulum sp. YNF3179 TaxID=3425127 RepID=UPI003D34B102
MDALPAGLLAALVGLIGGLMLGLAARLGEFCTLGAIESAAYGQDQRRLRMWGVTLCVAIIGTFALSALGAIDLSLTIYHGVAWNPAASVVGGLLFGYGMAYAGNCGFGALTRFGGGDLRALVVVVVMAIFGFITLNGPLAPLRDAIFPQSAADGMQGVAHTFGAVTGLPPFAIAVVVGLGFLAWALAYAPLRGEPRMIFWAVVAGLAIVSGFWGTSALYHASFAAVPVEGHTYTAPLGRTLLYLMTSTAGGLSFPVGSVIGVLAGAFLGSFIRGRFRWEACEDPRELGRQVAGAALMGIGGVIALGCSVGQGLSAFATLAWSAPVTLAAIVVGGLVGLRHLLSGFQPE